MLTKKVGNRKSSVAMMDKAFRKTLLILTCCFGAAVSIPAIAGGGNGEGYGGDRTSGMAIQEQPVYTMNFSDLLEATNHCLSGEAGLASSMEQLYFDIYGDRTHLSSAGSYGEAKSAVVRHGYDFFRKLLLEIPPMIENSKKSGKVLAFGYLNPTWADVDFNGVHGSVDLAYAIRMEKVDGKKRPNLFVTLRDGRKLKLQNGMPYIRYEGLHSAGYRTGRRLVTKAAIMIPEEAVGTALPLVDAESGQPSDLQINTLEYLQCIQGRIQRVRPWGSG